MLWAFRPATGGPEVVVDRGWVAESQRGASVLPDVPPAPTGDVEVVGWVRPGQASRNRRLPTGQIASLNLRDATAALGSSAVLPGYVLLESEVRSDGSPAPRPQALGEPDRDLGPHQAYAYQWWLLMLAGFVLIPFGIRRELRARGPREVPGQAQEDPDLGRGGRVAGQRPALVGGLGQARGTGNTRASPGWSGSSTMSRSSSQAETTLASSPGWLKLIACAAPRMTTTRHVLR